MTFEIIVTSASIVRCESYEFALEYKDELGTLMFKGFDEGHPCGGMLYFPTLEEWDVWMPNRRGQRKQILLHLLAFVREKKKYYGFIERSLTDLKFFERWPRESNYLGRRYKGSPVTAANTGKLVRTPTLVDSRSTPPAVSRAHFDRPFRTQIFKTDVETVRLCSDRTESHPSRVEIQFLLPGYRDIPETFDGLALEDITDAGLPHGAIEPALEKWRRLTRLISLRANDGTRGLIQSAYTMFWEDDAPPGAPSKVPIPGTRTPGY